MNDVTAARSFAASCFDSKEKAYASFPQREGLSLTLVRWHRLNVTSREVSRTLWDWVLALWLALSVIAGAALLLLVFLRLNLALLSQRL